MAEDQLKEAMKEALKEWLDEKFIAFGKWSFGTIGALFVVAIVYFILYTHGWKMP